MVVLCCGGPSGCTRRSCGHRKEVSFRHCAHQGGSIPPLIIFTTWDASANSVAVIAKVKLIRLSLGRAISIDNFCGAKFTGAIENDRSIFRHVFRCSIDRHLDLRTAFGSIDKGCQGRPQPKTEVDT